MYDKIGQEKVMRKIFIDGGANRGQSTDSFLKEWPGSQEYEIYMFEPSKSPSLVSELKKREGSKIKFINKALWVNNENKIFFHKPSSALDEGATLIEEKKNIQHLATWSTYEVECLNLSEWILNNFSKEDYLILKLDVEGAEYKIIEHLNETGALKMVNKFFCEIHGLKCGKSLEESKNFLKTCLDNGLDVYSWTGETFSYERYENKNYTTTNILEKQYEKWEKRFERERTKNKKC